MRRILIPGIVGAVGAALLLAPAAQAVGDSSVVLTRIGRTPVGVQVQLQATVATPPNPSGASTVTFVADGGFTDTDTVATGPGQVASVSWTPTSAGQFNVTATTDTGASDSKTVVVDKVDTSISLTTPGQASTSQVVTLGAQVRASQGGYVPTGTVAFFTSDGRNIGNGNLDNAGNASLQWTTPSAGGKVSLYATYGGDANARSSGRSATDTIQVNGTATKLALVAPQTNYVGTPSTITANVTPASATGSVAFSANGTNLGTANIANGVASISWSPPSTGRFTLKAVYNGVTATNDVTVTQQLKQDVITINPAGAAGPWASGSTQGLANGASVALGTSAASGTPVSLSVTSPCSMNGNTLVVNGVGAPCALTAKTPGGNGYAPGSATVTIIEGVGTQDASVNPAASGSYRKGKALRLAPASALTNLGNRISWSVTSGKASCKISTSGGNVKVKLVKKGRCHVQGSAPAVPGQWGPFTVTRDYTVK